MNEYHEIPITDIERGCLHKGLLLLQQRGYIGAEGRRGFGQVQIEYKNYQIDSSLYDNYLAENKEKIINYLKDIKAIDASC